MVCLDVRSQILLIDLIAEDHHHGPPLHVRGGLGQRVGDPQLPFLLLVHDAHAQLVAVAQEPLELLDLRSGDQDQVEHPRVGQRADREIDHRLVEHVQEMLVHNLRHRIEPGAEPSGQNHAVHTRPSTHRPTDGRQSASGTPSVRARSSDRTLLAGRGATTRSDSRR